MEMDAISISRIQALHPLIIQPALDAFADIGCVLTGKAICRVQEGLRTFATQDGYYALGRTKVNPDGKSKLNPMGNIITNAKAGSSTHQYGLGIDYVLLVDGNGDGTFETPKWDSNGDYDGDKKADWIEIANIFKKYGFSWGGDWRTFVDLPHVDMTFGFKTSELLAKHVAGDFIPNTKYVFLAPTILVQKALNNHGFRLLEDGISGSKTIAALKHYQGLQGLKQDGIVGYTTAVKLGLYK